MKIKFLRAVFLFSFFAVVSCDRVGDGHVDDNQGGTGVEQMSGDWFVKFMSGNQVLQDYTLLSTYNSAANNGKEIWLDDHDKTWHYKVKVPAEYSSFTFSGDNLQNTSYDIKMKISDGKVLKKAATSTGGNKTDSIRFNVEFSDDPGVVYTVAGYKRTGFAEDEH